MEQNGKWIYENLQRKLLKKEHKKYEKKYEELCMPNQIHMYHVMVFLAATNTVRAVPTTNTVIRTESHNFLTFSISPIFSFGSIESCTGLAAVSFFDDTGHSWAEDGDSIFYVKW